VDVPAVFRVRRPGLLKMAEACRRRFEADHATPRSHPPGGDARKISDVGANVNEGVAGPEQLAEQGDDLDLIGARVHLPHAGPQVEVEFELDRTDAARPLA